MSDSILALADQRTMLDGEDSIGNSTVARSRRAPCASDAHGQAV